MPQAGRGRGGLAGQDVCFGLDSLSQHLLCASKSSYTTSILTTYGLFGRVYAGQLGVIVDIDQSDCTTKLRLALQMDGPEAAAAARQSGIDMTGLTRELWFPVSACLGSIHRIRNRVGALTAPWTAGGGLLHRASGRTVQDRSQRYTGGCGRPAQPWVREQPTLHLTTLLCPDTGRLLL